MLGRYYLRNCTRQEIIMIIIFMKPLTSLSFSFFFRRRQGVCVCVLGGGELSNWMTVSQWMMTDLQLLEQPHHSRGTPVCSAEWGARCRDQWAHQHSVDVKTAVDRREVHQVLSTQFLHDNQAEKPLVLWGWLILICTTLLNVVPLFVNTSMNGFI